MTINHNILRVGMIIRMVAFPLLTLFHANSMVEPTLSSALLTAQSENRQLLLFFTSKSCDKCREVEDFLTNNSRFGADNKKFIAAVVDIDDFDGKACSEIYGIDNIPTFLIVRPDGTVRFRTNDASIDLSELEKAIFNDQLSNTVDPKVPEEEERSGAELGMARMETASGMYSLQLGYFSGKDNATTLMKKAEGAGYRDVTINTEMRNEKPHYRVLVGTFPDETEAEQNMKKLQADGFEARVYRNRP